MDFNKRGVSVSVDLLTLSIIALLVAGLGLGYLNYSATRAAALRPIINVEPCKVANPSVNVENNLPRPRVIIKVIQAPAPAAPAPTNENQALPSPSEYRTEVTVIGHRIPDSLNHPIPREQAQVVLP
jgi:hypothetical protein